MLGFVRLTQFGPRPAIAEIRAPRTHVPVESTQQTDDSTQTVPLAVQGSAVSPNNAPVFPEVAVPVVSEVTVPEVAAPVVSEVTVPVAPQVSTVDPTAVGAGLDSPTATAQQYPAVADSYKGAAYVAYPSVPANQANENIYPSVPANQANETATHSYAEHGVQSPEAQYDTLVPAHSEDASLHPTKAPCNGTHVQSTTTMSSAMETVASASSYNEEFPTISGYGANGPQETSIVSSGSIVAANFIFTAMMICIAA